MVSERFLSSGKVEVNDMPEIYIDADGSPVVDLVLALATKYGLKTYIICDTSHHIEREGAETVIVSRGADAVDFVIVNRVKEHDIVITQDYGLAAMVLARRAHAINQNGLIFTDKNIGNLLESRHFSQKVRRAGGRTKGPKKRTKEQDEIFAKRFEELIRSVLEKAGE